MNQPDIRNLPNCIEDARQAGLDQDPGPMEPLQFNLLRGRLQAVQAKIPPLYREAVFTPFVQTLDEIGESGFNQILVKDPKRVREAGLMLDIAQAILQRTEKDVKTIVLAGKTVEPKIAKQSAEIVSRVIVTHPMVSLEHHAFGEIQNWRDTDEAIVQRLRVTLTTANPLPSDVTDGIFAAHLVAAAAMAALAQGAQIPLVFQRMLDGLKSMNEKNPSFGPLRVWHPGNLVRDRSYVPFCAA